MNNPVMFIHLIFCILQHSQVFHAENISLTRGQFLMIAYSCETCFHRSISVSISLTKIFLTMCLCSIDEMIVTYLDC